MTASADSTTILTEDVTTLDTAWDGERPIIDSSRLAEIVGWELKPEGLCRDVACVLVPDRSVLEHRDGIDLAAVAVALGRPVLVDADARMVAVGAPAVDRQRALLDRQAPDAAILDLQGAQRSLSEWSGRRRLLVVFASW